jgi:hypothetical protein
MRYDYDPNSGMGWPAFPIFLLLALGGLWAYFTLFH